MLSLREVALPTDPEEFETTTRQRIIAALKVQLAKIPEVRDLHESGVIVGLRIALSLAEAA